MALSQSEGKAIERSSKSKTRQSETQSKLSKSEFGVNFKIFTQIPVLDDVFGWQSESRGVKHSNFLDPCPQPSKSPLSNIWIAIWMRGARDLDEKVSKYPIWIPFGWFYDSLMNIKGDCRLVLLHEILDDLLSNGFGWTPTLGVVVPRRGGWEVTC